MSDYANCFYQFQKSLSKAFSRTRKTQDQEVIFFSMTSKLINIARVYGPSGTTKFVSILYFFILLSVEILWRQLLHRNYNNLYRILLFCREEILMDLWIQEPHVPLHPAEDIIDQDLLLCKFFGRFFSKSLKVPCCAPNPPTLILKLIRNIGVFFIGLFVTLFQVRLIYIRYQLARRG